MRRDPVPKGDAEFIREKAPRADLAMLEYIIWYGRKKSGTIADVAARLWWECPFVRLSDVPAMTEGAWEDGNDERDDRQGVSRVGTPVARE